MIKILTLLGNNYGGCLQAYALQHKIKELGHNSTIVNYTEYLNKKPSMKGRIKRVVYYRRNQKFEQFRKENFVMSSPVEFLEDDGSVYIVGSDQVWNPAIAFPVRKHFYLDFVKDASRKNAYAASVGDMKLDNDEENITEIIEYINDFHYLSVREKSSIGLIQKYTDKKISNVLDPTLLLSKEDWEKVIPKVDIKPYVFVYTLGLNSNDILLIDQLCQKKQMKIRDVFYKKRFRYLDKKLNHLGPSEWLAAIASSSFVITNSFHGTVFSIINHKEFLVITRNSMNNRIYDLLESLGITGRIFHSDELQSLGSLDSLPKIDYKKVDQKLHTLIQNSVDFLNEILNLDK